MADPIFITGTATGSLKEGFSGMPEWATDVTAKKISRQLGEILKTVRAKSSNSPNSPKSSNLPNSNKAVDDVISSYVKSFGKGKKQGQYSKSNEFESKWTKAVIVLDAFRTAGVATLKAQVQYLKTYDSLYKSGVNVLAGQNEFSDGFSALSSAVSLTGLRLETLQEVSQKYSGSINAVGFIKFTKATAEATKQVKELNYSSKDAAELIGAYSDASQSFSDVRRRSEKQLADDAANFGKSINRLSLLTGVSREQMMSNTKAMAKSTDVALIYSKFGKEGADKMLAFASSFPDQALGKSLLVMVADMSAGVGALNSTFQELTNAGLGPFANELSNILKESAIQGPEVTRKRLAYLSARVPESKRDELRIQARGGNASAAQAEEILNNIAMAGRGLSEATDEQLKKANKTQESIAKLDTEKERLSASIQAAFPPMIWQVEALTTAMKGLNDVIYGVINNTPVEGRSGIGSALAVGGVAIGALLGGLGGVSVLKKIIKLRRAAPSPEPEAITPTPAARAGATASGKTALKAATKGVAKMLPGLSLLYSAADGINRFKNGDYLGAGIAGVASIASLFPGLGTAVAVGLDAVNLAKDYVKDSDKSRINDTESKTDTTETEEEQKTALSVKEDYITKELMGFIKDLNEGIKIQIDMLGQILQSNKSILSTDQDLLRITKNR